MSESKASESQEKGGKSNRRDNHRLYRPEAVAAHATRGAGEPWEGRLPAEHAILAVLTLLAAAGLVALYLGAR
ncbi:MAG TPA: hypothetical protein VM694_00960 [Polyangium sp.]|nr:hypothetical protein [Polyangium sp.]